MKKLLIVYYSLSCGNTERVARLLQSHTGADLLRIETAVPYPGSYDRIVEQGKEEVLEQTEPAIKPLSLSPESYAAIAVGSPTWWYTMAPAVRTFLHGQNFRGKTVIPFTTNGGWPGHALADIEAACPGAQVACPLQVRFDAEGGDRLETPEPTCTPGRMPSAPCWRTPPGTTRRRMPPLTLPTSLAAAHPTPPMRLISPAIPTSGR